MYKKCFIFLLGLFASMTSLYAQIDCTYSFDRKKLAIDTITGRDGKMYNRLLYGGDYESRVCDFDILGYPEVLKKRIELTVPSDATGLYITLEEKQSERISMPYKMYPVQYPEVTSLPKVIFPFVEPDSTIYHSEKPYPDPERRIELLWHRKYFDECYVVIDVCFTSYYPVLNELELFTYLSFKLNYSTPDGIAEMASNASPFLSQPVSYSDSNETHITCSLPTTAEEASLCLFDLTGKQVKKIFLTERGNVSVSIKKQEIGPGFYICWLVADGKKLGSCKIAVTN